MFWGLVLFPCSCQSEEAYPPVPLITHFANNVNINVGRDRDWVDCIPIHRHVPILAYVNMKYTTSM
jgi:hypothetical protein